MSAAVLGRCGWLQRGASLADAYLDALGLYFGRLWHHDLQHAVLRRGLDLVGLHVAGQGDRAAEGAVEPLGAVHLLLGGVVREVPLALDGQQAVLEGDLHLVGLDAGKLDRHQVGVLAFGYVDRRSPDRGAGIAVVLLAAAASRVPMTPATSRPAPRADPRTGPSPSWWWSFRSPLHLAGPMARRPGRTPLR